LADNITRSLILVQPNSPLFPYTTLFRSCRCWSPSPKFHDGRTTLITIKKLVCAGTGNVTFCSSGSILECGAGGRVHANGVRIGGSGEDTSDLQSNVNIV